MKATVKIGDKSSPTFRDLEEKCQASFDEGGPYWHICTNGNKQEIIFTSVQDFVAAMNALAVVLNDSGVCLIAFIFMNNHVHFIMEGPKDKCLAVFRRFKRKLNLYLSRSGRAKVLTDFDCGEPISIDTLDQMRTEICYVHRNMYVARNDILPHTWSWGSGALYFNPVYVPKHMTKLSDLTYDELRKNFYFGRDIDLPCTYVCANGYIQPECFVNCHRGESFFRHASHYMNTLMKDRESFCLMARRLGDSQILNNEEIYSAAVAISHEKFGNSKPQTIPQHAKVEIARILHFDYKVDNATISRILKLDHGLLTELYPDKS